jgi:hypothetical protein
MAEEILSGFLLIAGGPVSSYYVNPETKEFIIVSLADTVFKYESLESLLSRKDRNTISFYDCGNWLYGEIAEKKLRELCDEIIAIYNLNNSAKSALFKK